MSNRQKPKQRPRQGISPAAPPRQFWQSPIFWVIGLVGIALIAALALTSGGGDDDAPPVATETAFAEILGVSLPPLDEPDTAIGQTVPALSAQTLTGDRVEVSADGTARLYGFFAHWCPHCQAELPRTADWLETNDLPDGVEVIAISTAVEPTADNYPPSDWFARENWPARVLIDDVDRTLAAGFGLTGFPYWVAVDSDGVVVERRAGELSIPEFESLLDAITPGDAELSAATPTTGIRVVSPTEAAAIHDNPPADLVVLDVRTPEEFAQGHLDGAIMIDFYEADFADRLADLDPDVPYLLYCRSGNRSEQARAILEELEFSDVADIDGGILGWTDAGLPLVTG